MAFCIADYSLTYVSRDEKCASIHTSIVLKDSEASPAASQIDLPLDDGYSTVVRRRQQVAVLFVGFISTFQVAGTSFSLNN